MPNPTPRPLIAPSQGIHLVFEKSFLPGDSAIMVPHTSDGRVMFAIPWQGHTLVGTTDTAIEAPTLEPRPFDAEIDFILETAGQYLHKAPTRADVLSVFVGIRPLVKRGDGTITSALSRDHTIHIDASGLLTIAGGKWTTYRHMAEDTVDPGRGTGAPARPPVPHARAPPARLSPERRPLRPAERLRRRCPGDPGTDAGRPHAGRAPASGPALHRR